MKNNLAIVVLLFSTLVLKAQKNEISFVTSSDFLLSLYDNFEDTKHFSLGLKYSRTLWKRIDLEAAITYNKHRYDFIPYRYSENPGEPIPMHIEELNAQLGLKWGFIKKEKFNVFTSLGFQARKEIPWTYSPSITWHRQYSKAIYHDIGIRFKLKANFSIDVEFKTRQNFLDPFCSCGIKTYSFGMGTGFNYSF